MTTEATFPLKVPEAGRADAVLAAALAGCSDFGLSAKPVIYLYPEEETEVTVTLELDGTFTSTYPDYGEGWTVNAAPDGTLTDPDTGRTYYCLFWEGVTDAEYDFSTGFCVAGADTAAFLFRARKDPDKKPIRRRHRARCRRPGYVGCTLQPAGSWLFRCRR